MGVAVGRALSMRDATSKVGVGMGVGRGLLVSKMVKISSTVIADTSTLSARKGKYCFQVDRRTLPTAADHSIGEP